MTPSVTVRHFFVPVHRLLTACFSVFSAAALTVGAAGCSDASGQVQGGELIFDANAPVTADDGGAGDDGGTTAVGPHAFTDLYTEFFGPPAAGALADGGMGGKASCAGSPASCHALANDPGASFSGFACGSTQADCYKGMTTGACSSGVSMPCPIVQTSGAAAMTGLHLNLYKYDNSGNMPLGLTYQFSREDMARIDAWIAEGAQNN